MTEFEVHATSTLTVQDQECRQNGKPLVKYDAMLIYATDEVHPKGHPLQGQPLPDAERSDVFAAHLRERMESAGLQVSKQGGFNIRHCKCGIVKE